MRILGWTNAPFCFTGYGIQIRELSKRLLADGHEVGVVANYGLSGNRMIWDGVMVYPLYEQSQNADVIGLYADDFHADIVLSLYDIWALPPDTRKRFAPPWVALTPVDGAPLSAPMIERLRTVDYPVAYSQFGVEQMQRAGFRPDYVPHAIDCDVFKPGDKAAARDDLGFPQDRFVVSIVAANKGFPARKAWPEALAGFKLFYDAHPDAFIYCHTTKRPLGSNGEGIYFDDLNADIGIPGGARAFPNQGQLAMGVLDEQIAKVYQASDVMLLPSMGEGFGLPVIEAQACGCPVITQACSAMTELTVNGIATEPLQSTWLPQLRYYWQIPSIQRIYEALEELYGRSHEERAEHAGNGVRFVRDNYSWPVVWARHWQPFIERVEDTLW